MTKTTIDTSPKTIYNPILFRPIWVIAKENNAKGRRVTKRMNPECRRVGVL